MDGWRRGKGRFKKNSHDFVEVISVSIIQGRIHPATRGGGGWGQILRKLLAPTQPAGPVSKRRGGGDGEENH